MSGVPAVVIAAPASGSGKTTVATGLMAALRQPRHWVAPFKVGPDYIDPGYHVLAAGRPGRNLDPVFVGEDLIAPLSRHGSAGSQIAVVEGVMGLFDGRMGALTGPAARSTADVAGLLGAPVILVVDSRGQSTAWPRCFTASRRSMVHPDLAGVILNRVGSPRHEDVLRRPCERPGCPVLGALPRRDALAVPSRHLGLVTAAEHGAMPVRLSTPWPRWSPPTLTWPASSPRLAARVSAEPWSAENAAGDRTAGHVTVALAAGKAFSFCYAEHPELLRAAGADVVEFDPLTEQLPPHTAALVLPGGFPEEFSIELSANDRVRQQVAALAADGAPVHAECAGLIYLVDELDGISDVRCAGRHGAVHQQAEPGLPRCRRGGRLLAIPRRRAMPPATSSTAPQ